jgi:hypothetical protein
MKYFNQIKSEIKKGEPRPAWTYRGARRNVGRNARAHLLRMVRKDMYVSRSEHDRQRWLEAQAERKAA